jgi:tRNA1(Val) A37 N6-methylase TrmN6
MEKQNHTLSSQAIGAIMMALQKALIEQSDVTETLQGFEIQVDDSGELVVMNPPTFEISSEDTKNA